MWQVGKKRPSFLLALCELPHHGVLGAEAEVAPVVAPRGDRGWASSQAALHGPRALMPGASGFGFSHLILGLLKATLWNNYELRGF